MSQGCPLKTSDEHSEPGRCRYSWRTVGPAQTQLETLRGTNAKSTAANRKLIIIGYVANSLFHNTTGSACASETFRPHTLRYASRWNTEIDSVPQICYSCYPTTGAIISVALCKLSSLQSRLLHRPLLDVLALSRSACTDFSCLALVGISAFESISENVFMAVSF